MMSMKSFAMITVVLVIVAGGSIYYLKTRPQQHGGSTDGVSPDRGNIDVPANWTLTVGTYDLHMGLTKLPMGPATMESFTVEYPEFTEEFALSLAKEIFPDAKGPADKIDDDNYHFMAGQYSIFIKDDISVHASLKDYDFHPESVIVQNASSGSAMILSEDFVDQNEAKAIALEFLEDRGLIPDDGKLENEETSTMSGLSFKINVSYSFDYYRYVENKYPVRGWHEKMYVVVDNVGTVSVISKCWLSKYQQSEGAKPIHDSLEAANSIKYIHYHSDDTDAPLVIDSVELAYQNFATDGVYNKIRPVWIFKLSEEGTLPFVVDAMTLEQYKN